MKRVAFCISDGTGITSETLGRSLLSQFDSLSVEIRVLPYINTIVKAKEIAKIINETYSATQERPIIIDTIVDPQIRAVLNQCQAFTLDVFDTFIAPLEREFNAPSSYSVGRSHSISTNKQYDDRMEAVNFALEYDDGCHTQQYSQADVILLGVSRCGKTPTCLYLALQYGIKAANYPLTEEDLEEFALPKTLKLYKDKLFGLTIEPNRLAEIRHERCADSRYASLEQCEFEVHETERIFQMEGIPFTDATRASVEELSTYIINEVKLKRKFY